MFSEQSSQRPLYVQNVNRWIDHYKKKTSVDSAPSPANDALLSSSTTGLAHEASMHVRQVEAKAPAPRVPSAGGAAVALRPVASSDASVQQASYDAQREHIENPGIASSAKRRPRGKTGKQSGKKKGQKGGGGKQKQGSKGKGGRKHKNDSVFGKSSLIGTPADIFRSKSSKKKKSKH